MALTAISSDGANMNSMEQWTTKLQTYVHQIKIRTVPVFNKNTKIKIEKWFGLNIIFHCNLLYVDFWELVRIFKY
jgi:hypothetical protein